MNQWERIAKLMSEHDITLTKIASIAGVAPSAVTKWKAGGGIKADALNRIAVHFSVSADWLLTGKDAAPEPASRYPEVIALEEKINTMSENLVGLAGQLEAMNAQMNTVTRFTWRCLGARPGR